MLYMVYLFLHFVVGIIEGFPAAVPVALRGCGCHVQLQYQEVGNQAGGGVAAAIPGGFGSRSSCRSVGGGFGASGLDGSSAGSSCSVFNTRPSGKNAISPEFNIANAVGRERIEWEFENMIIPFAQKPLPKQTNV